MAILEAVNDKAGSVAVDRPVGLDLGRGQHSRPCAFDRAICMELHRAIFEHGFLTHDQRRLTLGSQGN